YDPAGRTETITDANGTRLRYEYDALGRITSTRVDARGSGVIGGDGYTFTHDETGSVSTDVSSGYRPPGARESPAPGVPGHATAPCTSTRTAAASTPSSAAAAGARA